MNAIVKDVMTTQVIWVKQDTQFAAIAAALRKYRVSAFPVLNDAGQVVGVVSESDLLAKQALGGGGGSQVPGMITGILRRNQLAKAGAVVAADLMTSPPVTVSPDDTVEHAARLMYVRRVKRLPVVDADGHLAGIVSRADVLAVYSRPDADIGEEVRSGIVAEFAPDPGTFDVSVTDGVVTLTGRPRTYEAGREIAELARHVEGVVAVRDRQDYPPPRPEDFDVLASFPID